MLSLVILFLSGISGPHRKESVNKGPYTNVFRKLSETTGFRERSGASDNSNPCFYLDYKSKVALITGGTKYINPILYCPDGSTEAEFDPSDAEIYYTETIGIEYLNNSIGVDSIYIVTKGSSIKIPRNEAIDPDTGALQYYFDFVIAPVPSFTYTCSSLYCNEINNYSIRVTSYIKNSDVMTIKVENSDYKIKRKTSKRYSISVPDEGPFVLTESASLSDGLSAGAVVGIVLAVLVAAGVIGFCVYYFVLQDMIKSR